jgi:hypothetical protein
MVDGLRQSDGDGRFLMRGKSGENWLDWWQRGVAGGTHTKLGEM